MEPGACCAGVRERRDDGAGLNELVQRHRGEGALVRGGDDAPLRSLGLVRRRQGTTSAPPGVAPRAAAAGCDHAREDFVERCFASARPSLPSDRLRETVLRPAFARMNSAAVGAEEIAKRCSTRRALRRGDRPIGKASIEASERRPSQRPKSCAAGLFGGPPNNSGIASSDSNCAGRSLQDEEFARSEPQRPIQPSCVVKRHVARGIWPVNETGRLRHSQSRAPL